MVYSKCKKTNFLKFFSLINLAKTPYYTVLNASDYRRVFTTKLRLREIKRDRFKIKTIIFQLKNKDVQIKKNSHYNNTF